MAKPPPLACVSTQNADSLQGSPGNRESLISDYSASIHEGVPVSYVISKSFSGRKDAPVIYSAVNPPVSEETVGQADTPDGMADDISSQAASPSEKIDSSLRSPLMLASPRHSHMKNYSSIGSGNLASESGHSHNFSAVSASGSSNGARYYAEGHESNPIAIDQIDEEVDTEPSRMSSQSMGHSSPGRTSLNRSRESISIQSSDIQSAVSSIVPLLQTRIPENRDEAKLPDRSISSAYNPSIPPRSRNRPKSHLFIKDGLEDIQNQLQQQMTLDPESVSRASTNKSSTYYSAADQANQLEGDQDEFGKPDDDSYYHRPLPTVPANHEHGDQPHLIDRDSTLLISESSQQHSQKPPRLPSLPASILKGNDISVNISDDDYEDIVDETFQRKPSQQYPQQDERERNLKATPESVRVAPRKGKHKHKHKREMRSFDIDTISQMLNVTKGTLIGSEFADLGMKKEEKRALERLVDSLSRLTADMVLDPQRFQEGMKRLDKATRALEGF